MCCSWAAPAARSFSSHVPTPAHGLGERRVGATEPVRVRDQMDQARMRVERLRALRLDDQPVPGEVRGTAAAAAASATAAGRGRDLAFRSTLS